VSCKGTCSAVLHDYKQGRTGQRNENFVCNDHDVVEFKILRSGIITLDFRRAVFGHFRDLLGRIPLKTVMEQRGSKDNWTSSWLTTSKLKNSLSQHTASHAKTAGDLNRQSCS